MSRKQLKFVTELSHVREASLLGEANLAFRKNVLKDEDLIFTEKENRAQIPVTAADGKYMGIPFREVSFSVFTDGCHGKVVTGAYLLQAFNSSRLFAFWLAGLIPCATKLRKYSPALRRPNVRGECQAPPSCSK